MRLESKVLTVTLVTCLLGAMAWAWPPVSLGGGPGSDWTNFGGNARRNGLSSERGPAAPDLLWSGGRPSIIAWQPVTEGTRVFMVRQQGSPGEATDSPIVAMDLDAGAELWVADLPFNPGEWITWIAGVQNGRVYASRSNTESMSAKLYALDAASGAILWISQDAIAAHLYDGVVFAPDGDAIVGESTSLRRINSDDGATVWVSARQCWNHPSCGAAVFGDAIYVIEQSGISRFDLSTGVRQYSTTGDIGFGQTPPMVGTDGTIYVARANNAPGENFFYAFEDSGTALTERWRVPVGPTFASEFGIGPDGSVYMLGPGRTIDRLDPATGSVLDQSMPLGTDPFLQPRIAIDAVGRVFVSNGSFNDGRLFGFDADLTRRWDVQLPNVNVGAPVLGRNGTLVACGVGADVRAYRTTAELVEVDVMPGSLTNPINLRSRGLIPVAILSTPALDAPSAVDRSSLTFGRSGDEPSFASCQEEAEDVNDDGLSDLLCHFRTRQIGLLRGDTQVTLKGRLLDGRDFMGSDSVRIVLIGRPSAVEPLP